MRKLIDLLLLLTDTVLCIVLTCMLARCKNHMITVTVKVIVQSNSD